VKVFYGRIGKCDVHIEGFVVVSAFNKGHAVKLINKKLKTENCEAKFTVEELDLENKKGSVALVWSPC